MLVITNEESSQIVLVELFSSTCTFKYDLNIKHLVLIHRKKSYNNSHESFSYECKPAMFTKKNFLF